MESKTVTKSRIKETESKEVLKILHVDDNTKFIDLVEKYLKRSQKNFKITRAESSKEALEKLGENKVDCILSDYKMPGKDGLDLLKTIRNRNNEIPFILLTGKGSEEIASKAMSEGATDYFKKKGKSEDYEVLAQRIQNAVSSYRAKNQRNKTLRRIREGFISLDRNHKIEFINNRAKKQLKLSEKNNEGEKLWKNYGDDSSLKEKVEKAFEEQMEIETNDYNARHDKWFYIHIYPSEDSISLYLKDVTEKKTSQQQSKNLMKQQKVLANITQQTSNFESKKEIVEEISRAIWKGINCKSLKISGKNVDISKGNSKTKIRPYKLDIEVKNEKWGVLKIEKDGELTENDRNFLDSILSILSYSINSLRGKKDISNSRNSLKAEYSKRNHSIFSHTDFESDNSILGRADYTRDIPDGEETQKELKKYQKIVEAANDGLYIINSQLEVEIANEAFLELVDKPREEVIGENICSLLDLRTKTCERIKKLINRENESLEEQGKVDRGDKEDTYVKNIFKSLYLEDENFEGAIGMMKDITDYKEQKKGLIKSKNKSESRVERIVENLPGAAFRIQQKNGKWELESISDGVEDLLGKSADQVLNEGWRELIFEEDIPKVEEKLESGGTDSNAVKFRIQNGEKIRWMLSKASPVDNRDKNVLEGVLIDITDWKEYKKDLERTQVLLEAAPEPMIILDNELNVEKVNRAGREFFSVEKGDLSSLSFDDAAINIFNSNKSRLSETKLKNLDPRKFLKQKSRARELKKDLNKFIEDEEKDETTIETEIKLPTGEKMYVQAELRKIYDESGEAAGVASVIHDLTEMEKKKRSQKNKLDEFSSLVSHDLRNPLNLAQGYLDLARESESEEDFEVIEKAHVRMENIIDELMLITTEKDEIEKEKVDITEAFEEAFYFSGSENLEYKIEENMEIYADRSGLVSIFENLVSNSEEHNEGKIEVRVGKTDSGFYYEDNGRGVSEDIRDEIFEYGVSSDNGGVGLSIVKRIADISGWNIKLTESKEGGARFEFEL